MLYLVAPLSGVAGLVELVPTGNASAVDPANLTYPVPKDTIGNTAFVGVKILLFLALTPFRFAEPVPFPANVNGCATSVLFIAVPFT